LSKEGGIPQLGGKNKYFPHFKQLFSCRSAMRNLNIYVFTTIWERSDLLAFFDGSTLFSPPLAPNHRDSHRIDKKKRGKAP
jgi:hypothetical protein